MSTFNVPVTVTVEAKDYEEAIDLVSRNIWTGPSTVLTTCYDEPELIG